MDAKVPYEVMSADEHDRLAALYGPLTDDVRELIRLALRTDADPDSIDAARTAIRTANDVLRSRQPDESQVVRYSVGGRPVVWGNAVIGLRNAIAPPLTIHHDDDATRCWSEFTLNSAYEGPPGLVHGGVCALVLDHVLGEAASAGLTKPLFTGTLTVRFVRGTPLGRLRAEAAVERTEGVKSFVSGHLSDGEGITVEAEGIFIKPAWARERRMKFYVSSAFLDTREIVEIAKAADDLGYDGIGIPDHIVNLETLKTPYPYTKDGQRRWQAFTEWPDPWVLVGALAQVTTRLRFVTTVYIPAMRNPYSAAKAIGTAAYLADGRVELGVGVGWCEEEFDLMEQRFSARGKRTDEMLDLMRTLWSPGWTEFDGEFYQTPKLEMQPTPPRIPIYVGGLSEIALRRAARYDGWIGDLITTDHAIASAARLRELRAENGLAMDDFTILTPLTDAFTIAHYQRAEDAGIPASSRCRGCSTPGPMPRSPRRSTG